MVQVQRVSLADQTADVLADRIRDGEWALGAKLPGETTLAAQLGVGRTTVREAIRQLAGRGMLTTRQGSGVFVAALEAFEDWNEVVQRSDIIAVVEARIAIETEAARLAAGRRTPACLRAIRRALDQRQEHRDSTAAHVYADTAFDRSVVASAPNPHLAGPFSALTSRVRQAMITLLRIRPRYGDVAGQQTHVGLAAAIADCAPEIASN